MSHSNILALVALPTVKPERPNWGVYEHSVQTEGGRKLRPGVYWHTSATNSDGERLPADEWISTPVSVIASTQHTDDGSEGRLLRLVTRRGPREWAMPMEVFGGSGEEVRRNLFAMGAVIALKKRTQFMEYLLAQQPDRAIDTTGRPGWHESGTFVLPDRTIGSDTVRYRSNGPTTSLFTCKGEFAQWQEQVGALCLGNPVLTLAIGCALAGPLLSLVGVNGGGVHLVGDSSTGKSLAQLIAASAWGDPGEFAASWNMSRGGLEIEAATRNDTLLVLDEIKRADPKLVQEMAYALANGQGKGTMTREREGRVKLKWRLLTLSSGERSLADHAAIGGSPAHAGAELRMVDVNAGTRTYRAFDNLHGMSGAVFHRTLTVASSKTFGHIGPAFVERLIALSSDYLQAEFGRVRDCFVDDNAQAGRIADRFAVIALAGELAAQWGLIPWPQEACLSDCQLLYGEWLAAAVGGNTEERQILAGVRSFIDRYGDSRFSDVKAGATDPASRVENRAGYWVETPNGREYLFNSSGLCDAGRGYSLARIVAALKVAGALRDTDSNRKARNYRLPGGSQARLYTVDPERLDGGGGQP